MSGFLRGAEAERALATYASTMDPLRRAAMGIIVIPGNTPDGDRAYRVPCGPSFNPEEALAGYAKTLDPARRAAMGIVMFYGQTPAQDRAFRASPAGINKIRSSFPEVDLGPRRDSSPVLGM